jgi:uncharacterized membrane protein YdjX (TVP38/TMEM64 family)
MATHIHPIPGALVAGLGAFLVDLMIFEFIRFSFIDELHKLRTTAIGLKVRALLHHETISERIREYILWSMAGLIIASPLPDEIGVTMISSVTELEEKKFGILCLLFNIAGIFVVLMLAGATL